MTGLDDNGDGGEETTRPRSRSTHQNLRPEQVRVMVNDDGRREHRRRAEETTGSGAAVG